MTGKELVEKFITLELPHPSVGDFKELEYIKDELAEMVENDPYEVLGLLETAFKFGRDRNEI